MAMDDGGKSVYNQTILHTRSFSKEEVIYLQFVLERNFDLRTRLEEKKRRSVSYLYPCKTKNKT